MSRGGIYSNQPSSTLRYLTRALALRRGTFLFIVVTLPQAREELSILLRLSRDPIASSAIHCESRGSKVKNSTSRLINPHEELFLISLFRGSDDVELTERAPL